MRAADIPAEPAADEETSAPAEEDDMTEQPATDSAEEETSDEQHI